MMRMGAPSLGRFRPCKRCGGLLPFYSVQCACCGASSSRPKCLWHSKIRRRVWSLFESEGRRLLSAAHSHVELTRTFALACSLPQDLNVLDRTPRTSSDSLQAADSVALADDEGQTCSGAVLAVANPFHCWNGYPVATILLVANERRASVVRELDDDNRHARGIGWIVPGSTREECSSSSQASCG